MSGPAGGSDRRSFLKSAAAIPAAALGGRLADPGVESADSLDEVVLRSLAEVVLPAETLGPEGLDLAVADFQAWLGGFEPAAELDHGYLTERLRYGPPDPAPRWGAQLEALDLETEHRTGVRFTNTAPEARRRIVERVIASALGAQGGSAQGGSGERGGRGLPSPGRAEHVAIGLLAWFYSTSLANDLCYEARIGRRTCRGIDSQTEEPRPLEVNR